MFYTYIIRNIFNKRFYIGVTKNLQRRVQQHNRSKRRSITHFGRYELILYEKYDTLKAARFRERQIKSYKGGNAFKKLLTEKAN